MPAPYPSRPSPPSPAPSPIVTAAPWSAARLVGVVTVEDGTAAITGGGTSAPTETMTREALTTGAMAPAITSSRGAARDLGSEAGIRVWGFGAAPMSPCEPVSMQLRHCWTGCAPCPLQAHPRPLQALAQGHHHPGKRFGPIRAR